MYFLVTEVAGPAWDRSRPRRQQAGWTEHAAFVDALAAEGLIVLGGPVGNPDYGPVLLVFDAESETEIRTHLAGDPWMDTILAIESIEPWSVWVRGPRG
jgi:uncharacterized protein